MHTENYCNKRTRRQVVMTDKEKIREEVQRLMNELIQEKERGYGSDIDDACILELHNVLTYIDSLQEELKEEQPEYSFIESTYRCGKKSRWNTGDTLAYYQFTSDCEGEVVLGKVINVELDEECEDWFYTFDDGSRCDEESLLSDEAYKKN